MNIVGLVAPEALVDVSDVLRNRMASPPGFSAWRSCPRSRTPPSSRSSSLRRARGSGGGRRAEDRDDDQSRQRHTRSGEWRHDDHRRPGRAGSYTARCEGAHLAAGGESAEMVPLPTAKPTRSEYANGEAGAGSGEGANTLEGRADARLVEAYDTGVRGQGFGLSTGGGHGGGIRRSTWFSTPSAARTIWASPRATDSELERPVRRPRHDEVKFTIQRNGQLTNITVSDPADRQLNDNAAHRAVQMTRQVVALPAAFPNPTLTVDLRFEYQ